MACLTDHERTSAMTTIEKTRPADTFHVQRSTVIAAPPRAIFPLIDDFRAWTQWSPYEQLDANLGRTYFGPDRGVGAAYGWVGKKAGTGRMEILQSDAPSKIVIQLDFIKPFTAHNQATFTLERTAGGTRVTWAMDGASSLFHKVMGVFFSMDKLVGGDFEKGLANIKRIAEG